MSDILCEHIFGAIERAPFGSCGERNEISLSCVGTIPRARAEAENGKRDQAAVKREQQWHWNAVCVSQASHRSA